MMNRTRIGLGMFLVAIGVTTTAYLGAGVAQEPKVAVAKRHNRASQQRLSIPRSTLDGRRHCQQSFSRTRFAANGHKLDRIVHQGAECK